MDDSITQELKSIYEDYKRWAKQLKIPVSDVMKIVEIRELVILNKQIRELILKNRETSNT